MIGLRCEQRPGGSKRVGVVALLLPLQAEGLVPMVFTFRYVLSALRACDDRAQAYQRSLLLLEGMERLGLELDREGFKYAIEIAAKVNRSSVRVCACTCLYV